MQTNVCKDLILDISKIFQVQVFILFEIKNSQITHLLLVLMCNLAATKGWIARAECIHNFTQSILSPQKSVPCLCPKLSGRVGEREIVRKLGLCVETVLSLFSSYYLSFSLFQELSLSLSLSHKVVTYFCPPHMDLFECQSLFQFQNLDALGVRLEVERERERESEKEREIEYFYDLLTVQYFCLADKQTVSINQPIKTSLYKKRLRSNFQIKKAPKKSFPFQLASKNDTKHYQNTSSITFKSRILTIFQS